MSVSYDSGQVTLVCLFTWCFSAIDDSGHASVWASGLVSFVTARVVLVCLVTSCCVFSYDGGHAVVFGHLVLCYSSEHKNDHVRTVKILYSVSEFGGLQKHEQTEHALYCWKDKRTSVP